MAAGPPAVACRAVIALPGFGQPAASSCPNAAASPFRVLHRDEDLQLSYMLVPQACAEPGWTVPSAA